jgi:hypothetical protein
MCMLEPPLAGHAETPIRFPVPETKLKRDLFADVSLNDMQTPTRPDADTPIRVSCEPSAI